MAKYIEVPMSYAFLTGMYTLVFPSIVRADSWDCVPNTQALRDALLKPPAEGENRSQYESVKKDINRTPWLFGESERPLIEVKEQNGVEQKSVQKSDKQAASENPYNKNEFFIPADDVPKAREKLKEAAGRAGLSISAQESEALVAYSNTISIGTNLQGGALRGITENCFKSGWLLSLYQYVVDPKNSYSEGHRVTRVKAMGESEVVGPLKVTSYLETWRMQDAESGRLVESKKDQPFFKVYSEQFMVEKKGEQGVFTLAPQQQQVLAEETFWKETFLPRASKMLAKVTYFTPKDFFAFIPCLGDEAFRTEFAKKLATQPEYVFQFAVKWITKCYGQPELSDVLKTLAETRKAGLEAAPLQPVQYQSIDQFFALQVYLKDPEINEHKTEPVTEFLRGLKDCTAQEYFKLISDLYWNDDVSAENKDKLGLGLSQRLVPKLDGCTKGQRAQILTNYNSRYPVAFSKHVLPLLGAQKAATWLMDCNLDDYRNNLKKLKKNAPQAQYNAVLSAIPRRIRARNNLYNFINASPPRAVLLALGIALFAVGVALTLTGYGGVIGIPLALKGNALIGAAIGVGAAGAAAPAVLYGLGKLAVKLVKAIGRGLSAIKNYCWPAPKAKAAPAVQAAEVRADVRIESTQTEVLEQLAASSPKASGPQELKRERGSAVTKEGLGLLRATGPTIQVADGVTNAVDLGEDVLGESPAVTPSPSGRPKDARSLSAGDSPLRVKVLPDVPRSAQNSAGAAVQQDTPKIPTNKKA